MKYWKYWQMFVIGGGVIGLCLIPVLDVSIYFAVTGHYQNPADLLLLLERLALIGLILKYWLVVVGLVGLIGWFLISDPSKERPQGVVV